MLYPVSYDNEQDWPGLRMLAERGMTDAILDHIQNTHDPAQRISLYRFTIRKLAFDEWQNKNLDVMTALADAAIEECEQLGGDYLQQANVICYNTSANLCDCWNDGFPREKRHFEKGLEYAQKALWYREHLSKGPANFAMATWAIGKHQLSLGLEAEALESFRECVRLETLAAEEAGKPAEISKDAPVGYLIAAGYLSLMMRNLDELSELAKVLRKMEDLGGDPKEESEIIRLQLIETAKSCGLPDFAGLFAGLSEPSRNL
jgi:hypothetical protein